MRRAHPVLFFAAVILGTVAAVSIWANLRRATEKPWRLLEERIPRDIDGWKGKDLPLGETETVRNEVGKLNYNDYLYRVYRKNGREVFVYAMFWRQGRISVREMAGHTPDGCWVAGGAKYCAPLGQRTFNLGSAQTKAGECRQFAFPSGPKINVVWWHLWGGQVVDRSYFVKSVVTMLREIWEWIGRNGGRNRDQLMIRIHGAEKIEDLVGTSPATFFLSQLPVMKSDAGTDSR